MATFGKKASNTSLPFGDRCRATDRKKPLEIVEAVKVQNRIHRNNDGVEGAAVQVEMAHVQLHQVELDRQRFGGTSRTLEHFG